MDINDPQVTGYLHSSYAESLSEFGLPFALPRSGGWLLARQIPGSTDRDAMGCYPLFTCQDWSQLHSDLENLSGALVSLSLVASPFGNYDLAYLRSCFPDLVIPFKEHFVVDLTLPKQSFVQPHHRRNASKALRQLQVETCISPADFLADWLRLYATLVERHTITGIAAFSKDSFSKQLAVPGVIAFRATHEGLAAGMLLWYLQDGVAYYHLGAYSARGYELNASFACFNYAIDYFAQRGVRWLSLGSGAGADPNLESGLTRFKEGWATGSRTAYLCGRILDQHKYDELLKAKHIAPTSYFPAYRVGEFV